MTDMHLSPDIVANASLVPSAAVDSGEIKITFVNYSKFELRRDVTGYTKDFALGSVTSSPGPVLKARSGMETLDICQIAFSWIADGANNAYVTWYSPRSRCASACGSSRRCRSSAWASARIGTCAGTTTRAGIRNGPARDRIHRTPGPSSPMGMSAASRPSAARSRGTRRST